MSRCCNNCKYGEYYNDFLNLRKSIIENSNEGIRCALTGFCTNSEERCKDHKYLSGCEEYNTYVMYDDSYLSPGYFIISELDGEIIKFLKIYSSTNGYDIPHYNIRVFEKNSVDEVEYQYRDIVIKTNSGDKLFSIFYNFAKALKGSRIVSVDPTNEGRNNIFAKKSEKEVLLTFQKDIYGVRKATRFTDVNIGDNITCKHYGPINSLYRDLSDVCIKKTNAEDVQKILRLTK